MHCYIGTPGQFDMVWCVTLVDLFRSRKRENSIGAQRTWSGLVCGQVNGEDVVQCRQYRREKCTFNFGFGWRCMV